MGLNGTLDVWYSYNSGVRKSSFLKNGSKRELQSVIRVSARTVGQNASGMHGRQTISFLGIAAERQ